VPPAWRWAPTPSRSPNGNGASRRAAAQADYLLSYLGAGSAAVPIMLDIEYDPYVSSDGTNQCYGLGPAAMVSWVSAFGTEMQRKTGRLPIIYTPASWWKTCAGGSRLDKGGMCLHDAGNRSANGTPVNIWRCNGSAAQRWTVAPDDTVRIHGKCLAVSGSGTASGSPIDLHTCNGSSAEQWRVGTLDRLVNPASRKCLADPAGSTRNGKQTQLRLCSGKASQEWTLPAGPVASQIPTQCLDDSGNATASGTPIDLSACNGGASQAWQAQPDGTLRIHGSCLAVSRPGAVSGTLVDLRNCSGGRPQQWHIIADGAGLSLVNPASGLCLADPADATASGTQLEVVTCRATDPGMAWRVR